MTEEEFLREATVIRREIMELKGRLQKVKETYHEIEAITREIRKQSA